MSYSESPEDDQAAGLRRMFRQTPPEVLAVVPCGAGATPWVARQLHARIRAGLRLLALDEWAAFGNLADCLGLAPRFDLLQGVEGFVAVEQCRVQTIAGLSLMAVSRLSRALSQDQAIRQDTIERLRPLQSETDEWLIHARPCDIAGLSPLALAAPRLLLAVDPYSKAVTEAYTTLKRLRLGADTSSVGLAMTGPATIETRALSANLQSVARRQLGFVLLPVSSLGEAMAMPAAVDENAMCDTAQQTSAGFEERLLSMARHQARTARARSGL
ncbi:MAG TPA: hypothetical protein VFW00_09765 [Rhodocyclaceae bacterium]|nr:hypothetical protein [Rhodocyclaceae bacterium]